MVGLFLAETPDLGQQLDIGIVQQGLRIVHLGDILESLAQSAFRDNPVRIQNTHEKPVATEQLDVRKVFASKRLHDGNGAQDAAVRSPAMLDSFRVSFDQFSEDFSVGRDLFRPAQFRRSS